VAAEREPAAETGAEDEEAAGGGTAASRRRRRGGRGRGKGHDGAADAAEADDGSAAQAGAAADSDEAADAESAAEDADATSASGRRRRRRRRTGSGGEADGQGPGALGDDPPNTVVHVRSPRAATDTDVRAVKGSTRLEAKRQRRREGRESGRRRPPIITESEFLARREAVERVMVVRQHGERTQIAVLEDGVLVEHYVDKASHQSYVGNVYLGKVQNVLPSMEAAFVDIGKGRNAVLYAGEVNFDASGLEGESKRIESALKSGQSILVQVTKDPIGHKGARLTSQVSLPGRYLVYVPGASMTGISRKLPDTERNRLKQILKQVMPQNAGVIVRTAAEGASEDELSRDVARLSAQWEAIEKKSKTASAPDLLYSEPDLTLRVVRDIFNEDFSNLVIASDSEWDLVDEYVRYVAPHLADRMQRWGEDKDVFAAYRIDEQLAKALERKVWLPSGGSLVIDHTEAMTVIDVNTGKFTGQGGNLEQTVTRNNLEAAEEIVRQLRLRDLGGIIVIDFIDMVLESNRELVLRRLLECLARDRTKHQVAEVTSLGLVQMTRKRVGSGLLEAFSVSCEHCNGRGVVISMEPVDHSPGRGGKEHGSARNGPAHVAAASRKKASAAEDGTGQDGSSGHADRDGAEGPGTAKSRGSRSRSGRSAAKAGAPSATAESEKQAAAAEPESAEAGDKAASGRSSRSTSGRRRRTPRETANTGDPGEVGQDGAGPPEGAAASS
jgi:ribonuclease E